MVYLCKSGGYRANSLSHGREMGVLKTVSSDFLHGDIANVWARNTVPADQFHENCSTHADVYSVRFEKVPRLMNSLSRAGWGRSQSASRQSHSTTASLSWRRRFGAQWIPQRSIASERHFRVSKTSWVLVGWQPRSHEGLNCVRERCKEENSRHSRLAVPKARFVAECERSSPLWLLGMRRRE